MQKTYKILMDSSVMFELELFHVYFRARFRVGISIVSCDVCA